MSAGFGYGTFLDFYPLAEYQFPVAESFPVVRIPIAGPEPFNTLAVVRCAVPVIGQIGVADGRTRRSRVLLGTPFSLVGHDPRVRPPSHHSTAVTLQMLQVSGDTTFVFAVDTVDGEFNTDGRWTLTVDIADETDQVLTFAGAYASSWVLCHEPPVDTGRAPGPPTQQGAVHPQLFTTVTEQATSTRPRPPNVRQDDVRRPPRRAGRPRREVNAALLGRDSSRLALEELPDRAHELLDPAPHRPPGLSLVSDPPVAPRHVARNAPRVQTLMAQQLDNAYPWCTIGRVFFGKGTSLAHTDAGTGALVGRNLLLTASHLAPWDQPPGQWWMEFIPLYHYGRRPLGSSYVEAFRGIRNVGGGDVTGVDYVICKLYTPLGDRCGWMGARSYGDEDAYLDHEWVSVGYPQSFQGGETAAVESAIGIRDIDDDEPGLELETAAFSDHGWSGGPLWGWLDGGPRIIGVCSGREKDLLDPTRSVFAGGTGMLDLIRYGLANWS